MRGVESGNPLVDRARRRDEMVVGVVEDGLRIGPVGRAGNFVGAARENKLAITCPET